MTLRQAIETVEIRQIILETLMVGPLSEIEFRIDAATDLIVDQLNSILERKFEIKEKP